MREKHDRILLTLLKRKHKLFSPRNEARKAKHCHPRAEKRRDCLTRHSLENAPTLPSSQQHVDLSAREPFTT